MIARESQVRSLVMLPDCRTFRTIPHRVVVAQVLSVAASRRDGFARGVTDNRGCVKGSGPTVVPDAVFNGRVLIKQSVRENVRGHPRGTQCGRCVELRVASSPAP